MLTVLTQLRAVRTRPKLFSAAVALLLVAATAFAAAEDPQLEAKLGALPPGTPAVPEGLGAFELTGNKKAGALDTVGAGGLPFNQALRITTAEPPKEPWLFRIQTNSTVPLDTGDPMLVMFYARDASPGGEPARLQMTWRRQGGNYLTSYARTVKLTPEWKKYYIAFPMLIKSKDKPVADRFSSPAGEQMLAFVAGFGRQTIELGGIEALRFPRDVSFDRLPNQPITYNGREPDAAWRREAEQRIEKHRKSDLQIVVTDEAGNPVADADVSVEMKRHEFLWGTAVADPRLFATDEENKRYQQELLRLFNFASPVSSLKWVVWEKSHEAIDTLDWIHAQGMQTRGHTLVWPAWRKNPGHLRKLESQPEKLDAAIEAHLRDIAPQFVGKVVAWDVLNEPYNNRDWINLLGQEKTVEWFKLARELDSQARLYLNENRLMASYGELRSEKHEYIEGLVKYLIDQGAPIQGIGMQGHFDEERITDPEIMWQIIERFAAFGLEMSVTEFDVDTPDEQLQADVTRDVMTLVFSHPQYVLFQMWGFWDGQHDAFNAPIFRKDWSVKPSGQVYMDLVFDKWWTKASGRTGSNGDMAIRGFHGTYDVTVKHGGRDYRFPVTLTKGGGRYEARLSDARQQEIAAAEAAAKEQKQQALAAVAKAHTARKPPKAPAKTSGGSGGANKSDKPQARIDIGTPRGALRLKLVESSGDGVKAGYGVWLGKTDQDSIVVAHVDLVGSEWASVSVTVEPQSDGELPINLKGKFVKGGGDVWVIYDDMEITGATLTNGDFEASSEATGWVLDRAAGTGAQGSVVSGSDLVRSGGRALRVSHDAKAQQSIRVRAGQSITLTAFVRLAPESAAGTPATDDSGVAGEDEALRGNDE